MNEQAEIARLTERCKELDAEREAQWLRAEKMKLNHHGPTIDDLTARVAALEKLVQRARTYCTCNGKGECWECEADRLEVPEWSAE